MNIELLGHYNHEAHAYTQMAGTEDWALVAALGDQGGYEWCDFNAFYSPSARRYFWHGDSGCSCNSWIDELLSVSDFENGGRDALLRAWQTFAKDNEYTITTTDYLAGVIEINNFKEPK